MGYVIAEVQLVNQTDKILADAGHLAQAKIRSMKIEMLVDSGAYMMAINEHIQAQLGLNYIESKEAELADGTRITCDVVGPLEVKFANRRAFVEAIVLPGKSQPLLGAIPMEYMDVLVDPRRQQLIVNPDSPYVATTFLK